MYEYFLLVTVPSGIRFCGCNTMDASGVLQQTIFGHALRPGNYDIALYCKNLHFRVGLTFSFMYAYTYISCLFDVLCETIQ